MWFGSKQPRNAAKGRISAVLFRCEDQEIEQLKEDLNVKFHAAINKDVKPNKVNKSPKYEADCIIDLEIQYLTKEKDRVQSININWDVTTGKSNIFKGKTIKTLK